jgi:Leucine Rich repeat
MWSLQSVDLACCTLTDAGISVLVAGCGQLKRIFIEGCDKVTDAGVSALVAGRPQLRIIRF